MNMWGKFVSCTTFRKGTSCTVSVLFPIGRALAKYANWEATLEPVDLLPSGLFEVPDEHTVLGPKGVRLTKSKALLGYVLAQYIDGDEAEPTRSDCVDLYIENALVKLKAYLFKLLQLQNAKHSKDSPPLGKD